MLTAPCDFVPRQPVVSVPTLLFDADPHIEVGIQWYGQTRDGPLDTQYLFPLQTCLTSGSIWGCGHADFYRVAWIGQAKDWPNPKAAAEIIAKIGGGGPETLLAYICNHVPLRGDRTVVAFVLPFNLLGDPMVGAFGPQPYSGMDILRHDPSASVHHAETLARFMEAFPPGVTVGFSDGTSITR